MRSVMSISLLALLCACYSRNTPEYKTGLEGKSMPSIDLLMADSVTRFNTNSILPGKPTILFAFEPWCRYCRAQTKSIISHSKSLEGINIYMLCGSKYSDLKKYYDKYQLNKYPNIKVGIDYKFSFSKYFKSSNVPYMAFYDRGNKLKQVVIGKQYIKTIREIALQ